MTQDGQSESFSFAEDGEFINLNGKYYLRYLEHQQGVATPVQFRLDDGEVHLHRQGTTETRFVFDLAQPTISRYQTEYGIMHLHVITTKLERDIDPDKPAGKLAVSYQLQAGGQVVGSYQLQLQFAA